MLSHKVQLLLGLVIYTCVSIYPITATPNNSLARATIPRKSHVIDRPSEESDVPISIRDGEIGNWTTGTSKKGSNHSAAEKLGSAFRILSSIREEFVSINEENVSNQTKSIQKLQPSRFSTWNNLSKVLPDENASYPESLDSDRVAPLSSRLLNTNTSESGSDEIIDENFIARFWWVNNLTRHNLNESGEEVVDENSDDVNTTILLETNTSKSKDKESPNLATGKSSEAVDDAGSSELSNTASAFVSSGPVSFKHTCNPCIFSFILRNDSGGLLTWF